MLRSHVTSMSMNHIPFAARVDMPPMLTTWTLSESLGGSRSASDLPLEGSPALQVASEASIAVMNHEQERARALRTVVTHRPYHHV